MIIDTIKIENAVREIFENIGTHLDEKVYCRLKAAKGANERESFALKVLTENAEIARDTNSPVCQDTGLAVVFLEIGQDVALSGKYVEDAVNDGVRQAYENFRKSSVHPLSRKNSGDNTPAIIHTRVVKGDKVKVSCMMKGFGSENMSRLFMLTPADGVEGVVEKVVETVKDAGSCPCPPVILGVGVGGTMEKAAIMSKHALLNDLDKENPDDPKEPLRICLAVQLWKGPLTLDLSEVLATQDFLLLEDSAADDLNALARWLEEQAAVLNGPV